MLVGFLLSIVCFSVLLKPFHTQQILYVYTEDVRCFSSLFVSYSKHVKCKTMQAVIVNSMNCLLSSSHSRCSISPWAHLLKRGSSRFSCLLTMCPRKDKNFASITLPSPDVVEVALQDKWFAQGRIQG